MNYDIGQERHHRRQEGRERAIPPSESNREARDAAEPTLREALWLSSWIVGDAMDYSPLQLAATEPEFIDRARQFVAANVTDEAPVREHDTGEGFIEDLDHPMGAEVVTLGHPAESLRHELRKSRRRR